MAGSQTAIQAFQTWQLRQCLSTGTANSEQARAFSSGPIHKQQCHAQPAHAPVGETCWLQQHCWYQLPRLQHGQKRQQQRMLSTRQWTH